LEGVKFKKFMQNLKSKKNKLPQFSFWQTIAFVLGAVLLTIWGMRFLGSSGLSGRPASSGVTEIQVAQFKEALSQEFSSGQGAATIRQEIGGLPYLYGAAGGGCGV